jgi:hypothetical protein
MTLPYEEDLVCEALPVGHLQFFNQEFGTPGKKKLEKTIKNQAILKIPLNKSTAIVS